MDKRALARATLAARRALAGRGADVTLALLEIDRAWRTLPDAADTLAPLYARLLAREARDAQATLRMIERASLRGRDPGLEALAVHALLQSRDEGSALARLEAALLAFCAGPDEALAQAARSAMSAGAAVGWVGLGPKLEFIGELGSPGALHITADGRSLPPVPLRAAAGRGLFRFRPAPEQRDCRFEFHLDHAPLLGSGRSALPQFLLDGRTYAHGTRLHGWVRIGWAPDFAPRVGVEDDAGRRAWAVHAKTPGSSVDAPPGWTYALDLRVAGLRGNALNVRAQLPDGRLVPLPDSPLLAAQAVRLPAAQRCGLRSWPPGDAPAAQPRRTGVVQRRAMVIVPVHGAREETLACLAALVKSLKSLDAGAPAAGVVVVDDASADPLLAHALEDYAARGAITLRRNPVNLGYAASVNRALALHPEHDAVLLNSDTLVFGDWLARLRAAAYAAADVGTVTPFTDDESIAGYGGGAVQALDAAALAQVAALAAQANAGQAFEIPVGVGSCLYLRRDCLAEVGAFDARVFGAGYGEETDFCLRARARGWRHRLAADVFVHHAGARSFGARRAALLERSARLVNLRHPGFDRCYESFVAADPLAPARRRLDEQRLRGLPGRCVLYVTLALGGGVERHVEARRLAAHDEGLTALVLRPAAGTHPGAVQLWTDALGLAHLRYTAPAELPALRELLAALRIERIELHHFLGLDARVIELVRGLGAPLDVYLHDYAWLCPRVTLLDGRGRYCGEPALAACEACVRRNGSRLERGLGVAALRQRSRVWLGAARSVVAPAADPARRYARHFAGLDVRVQPFGAPLAAPAQWVAPPAPGAAVRVAVLGAIGTHKGYDVLLACARDAARRRLALEFIVIGYTQDDAALQRTGMVRITGRYGPGEAAHLVARERPHLAWLPSVWPETWSYTLDEAVQAGLPVVAFDLGAPAERLRAAGLGILLALDAGARQINDELLRAATSHPDRQIAHVSTSRPRQDARPALAMKPARTLPGPAAPADADSADLSASVQVLPLPMGLYLFSVRAAGPSVGATTGQLALPAIHVGLGPGVRADQVEFICGPANQGTWLFAQGDLLVAKVSAAGATLILSSIRAPGGATLSIQVERLEGRADASTATQAAAPSASHGEPPGARQGTQAAPAGPMAAQGPTLAARAPAEPGAGLPLQISAHIRARGDRKFVDVPWAGRTGPGMWIESFSVLPLQALSARDIEYKGLTASGFETAWISDDVMCGTRGMSVPLVGFALRLKPGSAASAAFDCEYSGYFQSGTLIGPLRNGAPCRSSVANDPLEGLQVRVVARAPSAPARAAAADASPAAPVSPAQAARGNGAAAPSKPARAAQPKAAKAARAPAAKRAAPRRSSARPGRA